mgnify:CR=1 FL=1
MLLRRIQVHLSHIKKNLMNRGLDEEHANKLLKAKILRYHIVYKPDLFLHYPPDYWASIIYREAKR